MVAGVVEAFATQLKFKSPLGLHTSLGVTIGLFILFYSAESFLVLLTYFLLPVLILAPHRNEVTHTRLQTRNANY